MSSKGRQLWDEWNLRCFVLLSLFLQILLIVLSNFRKTRGNSGVLSAAIWLFYLLADWVAAFSVGLISSGQTHGSSATNAVNKHLAAFWAPFLLLHLGGPDAITAFSLEDNELWIRHLFGLAIQIVGVGYVFFQSLPNGYWIPTVLMFFAGSCKYAERTVALYSACLANFKKSLLQKPDPGPNYAQFMEEYSVLKASNIPVDIITEDEPPANAMSSSSTSAAESHDSSTLAHGYKYFNVFKGLIVDHMFSFHERIDSRNFFLHRGAVAAFEVMEVELNLMYDVLYTKYGVVHCKKGYACRFLCTALLVACLLTFALRPQHDVSLLDKIVTYILLGGAVGLDLLSSYILMISDWSIISAKPEVSSVLSSLPWAKTNTRWSNTMSQHSFMRFCLKKHRCRFLCSVCWCLCRCFCSCFCGCLNILAHIFNFKDALDGFLYTKDVSCDERLKKFIFEELERKAREAHTREEIKEIYSARGEWVLRDYPIHYEHLSISSSVSEAEYDESLLLWHIATEICYFTSSGDDPNRKFCKALSDYMLYLVVLKPTLMSAVAGIAQIRFQDTCEEARNLFERWGAELVTSAEAEKDACEKLLKVKTVVEPKVVKGDRSKSLLFDACVLAHDLRKLEEKGRWEMMSRIWVELLCYAAGHCRPDAHGRQLCLGGELITFVWLLMVHFGLGQQFRIEAGHSRTKILFKEHVSAPPLNYWTH